MTTFERLHATGIIRTGTAKGGFSYRNANGGTVTSQDRRRINRLRIPPAWTDTAINSAESGRVQAVGKDAAGRWQYIYHENHVKQSERKKFLRLIKFAENLPALRKRINQDLRKPGLAKERVLAGIVRILSMSFVRPGNEIYANEHGSYGVTTLRPRHVSVKGKTITLEFPGKSGVKQRSEFTDWRVSQLMRQLLKQTNRRVFKYENGDGKLVNVTSRNINEYIREVMGRFSAKDFRTWSGTLVCACALARQTNGDNSDSAIKRKVVAAIKETAEALGNTPAVCRGSYICPAIITAFETGRTIDRCFPDLERLIAYRGVNLHPAEKALVRLLKKQIT
jgi:DNA topoisomerase-1